MYKHNGRSGIEPSYALRARIFNLVSSRALDELFADGDDGVIPVLDHLRKVARLKTIGVFCVAGEVGHEYRPTSDGYVLPGDGTTQQLASTIVCLMKGSHDFVRASDLPSAYRSLAKQWLNTLRARIRQLLVLEVVEELYAAGAQLWYFSGDEEWVAAQSLIDEYDRLLREVRGWSEPRPELPFNRRPWHGRPARDRRRAVMPGTSVGYAA